MIHLQGQFNAYSVPKLNISTLVQFKQIRQRRAVDVWCPLDPCSSQYSQVAVTLDEHDSLASSESDMRAQWRSIIKPLFEDRK